MGGGEINATFFGFAASFELVCVVVLPSVGLRAPRPEPDDSVASTRGASVRVALPNPRPILSSTEGAADDADADMGNGPFDCADILDDSVLACELVCVTGKDD